MRLLVLGGTSFVGGAVVEAALARGWSVTTFNRGSRPEWREGVETVVGDRTRPFDVEQLAHGRWDAVVDTWAGAPVAVRTSAELLADAVARYVYVSSRAVYASPYPGGLDESAATVAASAGAPSVGYAEDKRGGELAVEESFGGRSVLVRAGVILGPGENLGRMRSWLAHVARSGTVLAPGDPDQPWRYVDVRDLAAWMLDVAADGATGPYNVVNGLGHATTGSFLDACRGAVPSPARFRWVAPEAMEAAGVDRYVALPGWLPPEPEYDGFLTTDVRRAVDAGLRCRPVHETVADTLDWLRATGGLGHDPARDGDEVLGVDPEVERRLVGG
jgi:nucleoside-diphosphate-sugar epimerase